MKYLEMEIWMVIKTKNFIAVFMSLILIGLILHIKTLTLTKKMENMENV